MSEVIEKLVAAYIERRGAAIEEGCERSLLDPLMRGVLVEDIPGFGYRVSLSETVPWGQLHEKPVVAFT